MSVPAYLERAFDPDLEVSRAVNPSDAMFKAGREAHYHGAGRDAVQKIASILFAQGNPEPKRILDFGCGYGRVMRHIRAVFPESTIFGADTIQPALDFCAATFGSEPIRSFRSLAQLSLPSDLDMIWAGSVATHLPEADTRDLIGKFVSHIRPGGIAIFTTHGRYAASAYASGKWFYHISEPGFRQAYVSFLDDRYGYVDYEGQKSYGFSLTPGSWLTREASRYTDIRQVAFIERGWDNHQDVVAFRRAPPFRDGVDALLPPKAG